MLGHANPDRLFPTDGVTVLALALHIAMATDEQAQARYLAIYGESWDACDDVAQATGKTFGSTTSARTVR